MRCVCITDPATHNARRPISRPVVQRQHDLKDGVVIEATRDLQRFDHLGEGNILMGVSFRCADLDPGERDAILLAQELEADELLIDDMRGRREAERRHLHFIGTIAILQAAARQGLLDLRDAFDRLRRTNFHIAQEILDRLLTEHENMTQENGADGTI